MVFWILITRSQLHYYDALDAQEAFDILCKASGNEAGVAPRIPDHLNLARGWYKEALESRGFSVDSVVMIDPPSEEGAVPTDNADYLRESGLPVQTLGALPPEDVPLNGWVDSNAAALERVLASCED